jgi:hypothetical protein
MENYFLIEDQVKARIDRAYKEAEMWNLAKLAKAGQRTFIAGQAAQKARVWRRIELAFWKQVLRKSVLIEAEELAIRTRRKANSKGISNHDLYPIW